MQNPIVSLYRIVLLRCHIGSLEEPAAAWPVFGSDGLQRGLADRRIVGQIMASLREAREIRGYGGYEIRMDRSPDKPEITIYDAAPGSIRALNARLQLYTAISDLRSSISWATCFRCTYQQGFEQDIAKLQAV